MNTVITISRQFGSGGREFARRLAKELNFDYYDKEIITAIVNHTELSEEYVQDVINGKARNLMPISIEQSLNFGVDYQMMQMKSVYNAQTDVIKDMATKSNCVIVGRCADYILKDVPDINLYRIFVYADMDARVDRCVKRRKEDEDITEAAMRKEIIKLDKSRARYYSDYTLQEWGDKEFYDMCLNTTNVVIPDIVPHIAKMFM